MARIRDGLDGLDGDHRCRRPADDCAAPSRGRIAPDDRGSIGGAEGDHLIEATIKAWENRDRLGEVERYGVEGNYLDRVKGDREGAIDAFFKPGKARFSRKDVAD